MTVAYLVAQLVGCLDENSVELMAVLMVEQLVEYWVESSVDKWADR